MPEDGKKAAIAIGVAGLGIWALTRKAKAKPGKANLCGKVTDAVTGKKISGVLVSLDGLETITNAAGDYAFTNLEPGGYTVIFEKSGYETAIF